MKVMFLDESGDHSLSVIDPSYPLFVPGGIIMDEEYAEKKLPALLREFKMELFGRVNIVLHTADMARNRNGFERMKDSSFRQRFYERLNHLMRTLDYQVVACVVKKDAHLAQYGMAALDPYMLSLESLVERFCFEIGKHPHGGLIMVEKRDLTLDHELELAWLNLKIKGTASMQARDIEERIVGLVSRQKKDDIAGLQLADLVVSPVGRFVLGKPVKEDFRIIESKFCRDRGKDYRGAGLVVLPNE